MKGLVFNIVEEVVVARLGLAAWDTIVKASGVSGAYTSLGTYDDGDLRAIVAAAASTARITEGDVLRLVGIDGFALLAGRAPELLADVHDWRMLFESIDAIVHAEVDLLFPGAVTPRFDVRAEGDAMVLVYRSPRAMCALADGLARGAGRWFGVELAVDHLTCTHLGDDRCELLVREAVPNE